VAPADALHEGRMSGTSTFTWCHIRDERSEVVLRPSVKDPAGTLAKRQEIGYILYRCREAGFVDSNSATVKGGNSDVGISL
jgi:hypothetical protein